MTLEKLRDMGACLRGLDYAFQFESVKDAWLECNNISHMLWLCKRFDRRDLLVIFTTECAERTLTYTGGYTYHSNEVYYGHAAAIQLVEYLDYPHSFIHAPDHISDLARAAADYYYGLQAKEEERVIQIDRLKELFTDVIFPTTEFMKGINL